MDALAWPAGAATGIGSLPGTDAREAARLVLGELPLLPHLPELPGRGAGADLVGRGATLLADLHIDLQPSGWRLVDRPGVDERRAWDYLRRDLDDLTDAADGYAGALKTQVAGPWTLSAALHTPTHGQVLADPGAVREVTESLAEGVRDHVGDLRRRVPDAVVVVQVDEPSLPAVVAGTVRTASGFATLRAVEEAVVQDRLAHVLAAVTGAGATPVVHCCAADVPVALLVAAGARAVSVDARRLPRRLPDPVLESWGRAVEAGVSLWLGLVAAREADVSGDEMRRPSAAAGPARGWWRALGFPPGALTERVVVTPTCGMAGATPAHARAALRLCRDVAQVLAEDPEGAS